MPVPPLPKEKAEQDTAEKERVKQEKVQKAAKDKAEKAEQAAKEKEEKERLKKTPEARKKEAAKKKEKEKVFAARPGLKKTICLSLRGTTRAGEDDMLSETVCFCSIMASSALPSHCAQEGALPTSSTGRGCHSQPVGNGSGEHSAAQAITPFVSGRSPPISWITWQAARERHNMATGILLSEEIERGGGGRRRADGLRSCAQLTNY